MTKYLKGAIDAVTATSVFEYLRDNIEWVAGVRSRQGFTRLAKSLDPGEDELVDEIILEAYRKLSSNPAVVIFGIYLNYYKDGTHFTPKHRHPGMTQIVVSLGATRTLTMGSTSYTMSNGDAIMFGSDLHGVPKAPGLQQGRISIAAFTRPITMARLLEVYPHLALTEGAEQESEPQRPAEAATPSPPPPPQRKFKVTFKPKPKP